MWHTLASAGTYNPPANLVPLGAPEGNNTAWVNVTGVIRQTLAAAFQPDTTYRLTVEVGSLKGFAFPGYELGLFAAGAVVVSERSLLAPGESGQFGPVHVAAWIGQESSSVGLPIEIRLGLPGSGSGQVDFDWVRLTAEAVPEPDGLVLLTGGLGALAWVWRRAQSSGCRRRRVPPAAGAWLLAPGVRKSRTFLGKAKCRRRISVSCCRPKTVPRSSPEPSGAYWRRPAAILN